MELRGGPHPHPPERERRLTPYVLLALSYVLGATPTSFWVGRHVHGVDLRNVGSGNLGATNTFRVLGWKAALPVMVVDVLKGFVPAFFFPGLDTEAGWAWALAYGAAAILGHVFSFWVGFRGGKGVATSAGVFLAIAPQAVGVALVVWLLALGTVRIVSVASLSAAVAIPIWLGVRGHPGNPVLLWFTLGLAAFVFWAHRSNIRRLLTGNEPTIRTAMNKRRDSDEAPARAPDASGSGGGA